MVSVRKIDLLHLRVPLKTRVKHASHDRTESDNLAVRVTLDDGTEGHGEGVPRPYVTGETVETTFETLSALDCPGRLGRITSFEALIGRLETLELAETASDPRGMAGNAARCALELAILDAYGRLFRRPVSDAIRIAGTPDVRLSERPTRVRYSGAITAATGARERASAWKLWLYGFAHVKLKVGVDGQDDVSRMYSLRKILGNRVDLRIDANEAWKACEVVERVRPLLPFRPSVLEQPLKHDEVDELAEIRPRIGVPVMLDESLCGYPDAVRSIERRTADMFNVRLSKCGGIIPALRIIGLARRSGVGVQLGCHPGETALLSSAGRHFASTVRGLRYIEGSYDNHILSENLTGEDFTFGYGGWAPAMQGAGLGVKLDRGALDRMTVTRKEIRYD